jgi:cytochrome c oxidase assembly protein subunit 15
LRKFALVGIGALALQIALGGWTSSNYAAIACPDLPTCQRSWWPNMDFRNAFVLWRGLGVDYEGGVLASPARVAIHFTHRLGAIVAGSLLIFTGLLILARSAWPPLRFLGALLVFAVLLQVTIGISMVHFHMPLPIATLHNAGAAFLVIVMVTLLRMLWPRAPEPAAGMLPLRRVDTPR